MAELVVVIPYLSTLWALNDCIQSFGDSDVPVLVVDNSPYGDAAKFADGGFPENVTVRHHNGVNLGVSASWNMGLDEEADQTLIMSQMVRLAPAELSRRTGEWGLDFLAKGIKQRASEYGLTFGDQGFHLISVGRKTVEEVGRFDENFLYTGEDDDYRHRTNLAGIEMPDWGDWKESGVHSIAFSIQKRIKSVDKQISGRQARTLDWYNFKWGCTKETHPGVFKTPFGNPNNPLSYWPEVNHHV